MKRILITGSSGMLGKDIVEEFSDDSEIFGITRSNIKTMYPIFVGDINDPQLQRKVIKEVKPDIIIHTAAIVNVDLCEIEKEAANNIHAKVPENLCFLSNAKFIYISTDSVFDGQKGNYREDSLVNPLNFYAKSKVMGEKAVLKANNKSIVVRTNIYGYHMPLGKSLAEWAIGKLSAGNQITGFSDVMFNPLYTKQLARIIRKLIDVDYNGIIHAVSSDVISKYDFLLKLAEEFNFNTTLVNRGSINDSRFLAKRPTKMFLNNDKLKEICDNKDLLSFNLGLKAFSADYTAKG